MLFPMLNVLYFTLVISYICVQCPPRLLSVVPTFRDFPVSCSGIFLNDFDGTSYPYYYWYHFFYFSHAFYFYCKVFIF